MVCIATIITIAVTVTPTHYLLFQVKPSHNLVYWQSSKTVKIMLSNRQTISEATTTQTHTKQTMLLRMSFVTNCVCTTWDSILSSCERIMACYPAKFHRSQRYGRAPLRRPRSSVQRCTCLDWRLNCILLCCYGNAKRVTNSIWTNASVFVLPPTEGYPKHRHKNLTWDQWQTCPAYFPLWT